IVLARGIEQFHPLFYEDPILPDNFDAMGLVAENIRIPIATGERLHTIFEFEMLLRRGAVQFVRPDVCMCGGITGAKKVAALAEANYGGVVPQNLLGPANTSPRCARPTISASSRTILWAPSPPPPACSSPRASRTSPSRNPRSAKTSRPK